MSALSSIAASPNISLMKSFFLSTENSFDGHLANAVFDRKKLAAKPYAAAP
jgi:hypothetical protein